MRTRLRGSVLRTRNGRRAVALLLAVDLVLVGLLVLSTAGATASTAATSSLSLNVTSARTEPRAFAGAGVTKGDPIANFKFIINVDDTGTTAQRSPATGSGCAANDPGYPASCDWPSIREPSGWAPIYAQGTQDDLAGLTIPDGRYLISVIADGYKIDGAHFCVAVSGPVRGCDTPLNGPLAVELQPNPLPDGTLRAFVFEDNASTNMGYDTGETLLAGFVGHIVDTLGEVTTDVYGNPLCTKYEGEDANYQIPLTSLDGDMIPIPIPGTGGHCVSDAEGMLAIPHLGSNRYSVSVTPPDGQGWIQTTTLEGNHDYDAWLMEGDTGYSTIFARGGEPTPDPIFGFVKATDTMAAGTGHIKGSVVGIKTYTPPKGGAFDFWGGNTGTKVNGPIVKPWLSLVDLGGGDTAVFVGQGNDDGTFDISGVPAGNYLLSWWDEPQDYNLNKINVTVTGGGTVEMGQLPLNGWWTEYDGYVFSDTNRNGVKDDGEPGIPNFTLTLRHRENNLMDRGQNSATTDLNGHYYFESGYPIGEWDILEAYSDSYYTTGITYQADNQPTPTTVKGAGVDVSALPIIGLSGKIDWGVHTYDATGTNGIDPQNGGIVGTVSYDTTRNELDPQYAATEDWSPGISGVPVELYAPIDCGTNVGAPCDADGKYELTVDGAYAQGKLLNTYVSESWSRPTGCTARDVDGNPLVHFTNPATPYDENVLVPNQTTDGECISSFMQEIQFGPYPTDQGTPDANFGAAVNGNYGFGDGCFGGTLDTTDPSNPVCNGGSFEALPAADYLVHVAIPDDATGKQMYKVTGEEDVNIGNGDQIIPQVAPPACAGSLHTVDLLGSGTDSYSPLVGDGTNGAPAGVTVSASTPVENTTFPGGATPYEGKPKPKCDTKLVTVNNGKSIVPIFNIFTDVPVPARLRAVIIDDVNFSNDPRSIMFGEKQGLAFAPVGIYDFANKLEYTTETDFNGIYDVLMPSTNHISCPTPSGVCANMYRFVANDPGVPGKLNLNYNPRYATHAAGAEAMPGNMAFADLAPTPIGVTVESPQTGLAQAVMCAIDSATPQLLAVSKPYADFRTSSADATFTIDGTGFGATKGSGQVTLDDTIVLPTTAWTATQISVTVPEASAAGTHQLKIRANNGQSTVNGLTFHVLRNAPTTLPTLTLRDNFDRANANTLGSSWSQVVLFGAAATRVNSNQAFGAAAVTGTSMWNGSGTPFGAGQGAALTFAVPVVNGTGLILKASGGLAALPLNYISVTYASGQVNVRTTVNGGITNTPRGTLAATFAAGDILTAVANADGSVRVWKNLTDLGSVTIPTSGAGSYPLALGGGRIGLLVPATARVDNVRAGNSETSSYSPNLYEVGPTHTYTTIQAALDIARTSAGDDLVVVYPGVPDYVNPRNNPRGAYYENLIMASPVKLQGVGPGGFQGTTFVPGSIIDASAFGGDTDAATAWFNKIGTLAWDGNQVVNDAQAIYILASQNATSAPGRARQFTSGFKASVDGFDIRGGVANGFPGNVNDLTGGPTGLPPTIQTQGGAIFANSYVRNLQVTNNVVENNAGAYGTIRFGTPDLPPLDPTDPGSIDPNNHNEDARIANNRIISNSGTNLAGGIGLFAGSDRYEVAQNDICGNFSLEYGGGVSAYGKSPDGKIHHNRIYFNMSIDEGGGIMVAGALAANPLANYGAPNGAQGSGAVDIYANQIQANLANDDGGGIRFLMAGNFPMNVYDNMIVNNVSTHEGGGFAIDDAPNVRFYNNTIMKNLTTATAVTSNGQAAPAGLATGANSAQLQATLPAGSPLFSNPLLFNDIFWDNRAGTRAGTTVTGIGLPTDATPINQWDIGALDGSGLLAPTNSIVQQSAGAHPYVVSPTNSSANPGVVSPFDVSVAFATWRQNPAFVDATLVTLETPPNLMGNYHLNGCPASPACNLGAASKAVPVYQAPPASIPSPATDFEDQLRPALGGFDSGADEVQPAPASGGGGGGAPAVTGGGSGGGGNPTPPATPLLLTVSGGASAGGGGSSAGPVIYRWNGTRFTAFRNLTRAPYKLSRVGRVDGYVAAGANRFYVSLSRTVKVPGLGKVAGEDVFYWNGGKWARYFDGSAHGLGGAKAGLGAISIRGKSLYLSTAANTKLPGVTGTPDDADIYRFGGRKFTRVWDASAHGVPQGARVDGYARVDATHFYMSFGNSTTTLPGLGVVQDEDVVYFDNGVWKTYFDGTAHGLTSPDQDVDAFDVQ